VPEDNVAVLMLKMVVAPPREAIRIIEAAKAEAEAT
jgi:hypothetical protein